MKILTLLVLLLLVSPAAAQWPGPPGLLKSGVVNASESGVSCTDTCAPLACASAYREVTALGAATNDVPHTALAIDPTPILLDADWTGGLDLTGEFSLITGNGAILYTPLVIGATLAASIECQFAGIRSAGGAAARTITIAAERGVGGLAPTGVDQIGLSDSVETSNDSVPFGLAVTGTAVLSPGDTLGIFISASVALDVDEYVSNCTITRLTSSSSTDCSDTFDVRRCVCE